MKNHELSINTLFDVLYQQQECPTCLPPFFSSFYTLFLPSFRCPD